LIARRTAETLYSGFGLASRQLTLAGVVPGDCVSQSKAAIGTGGGTRHQETGHDQRAEDHQHDNLPMDESGFLGSFAGLTPPII
jgi:hypothetical protein